MVVQQQEPEPVGAQEPFSYGFFNEPQPNQSTPVLLGLQKGFTARFAEPSVVRSLSTSIFAAAPCAFPRGFSCRFVWIFHAINWSFFALAAAIQNGSTAKWSTARGVEVPPPWAVWNGTRVQWS